MKIETTTTANATPKTIASTRFIDHPRAYALFISDRSRVVYFILNAVNFEHLFDLRRCVTTKRPDDARELNHCQSECIACDLLGRYLDALHQSRTVCSGCFCSM